MSAEKGGTAFRHIDCPVCGGKAFTDVLSYTPRQFLNARRQAYYDLDALGVDLDTEFKIKRCAECSFVLVNPRFRPELYNVVYNEAKVGKYAGASYLDDDNDVHSLYRTYLSANVLPHFLRGLTQLKGRFAKPENRDVPKITFLDYGCGMGGTLELAKAFGVDAYGVDLDGYRLEYCRNRSLKVCRPEELGSGLKFDLVVSTSVIEHVDDLNAYFTFISERLNPGGVFVFNGLTERAVKLEMRSGRFHRVMPLEHINYFTPKSLDRITNRFGLRRVPNRIMMQSIDGRRDYLRPLIKDIVFKGFQPTGNFDVICVKS